MTSNVKNSYFLIVGSGGIWSLSCPELWCSVTATFVSWDH